MSAFAIDLPDSLIIRFRAGDHAAFEAVYRLFERAAWTLARRIVDDADEASEVLHDALIAAFERAGEFRGEAPFWSWLRQIVVNHALMRIRKRRLDFDDTPIDDIAIEDLSSALVDRAALLRALALLEPVTRSIVWLTLVEGYTHDEIGALFARSASFSKSQLARGLKRLRQELEPQPQEVRNALAAAAV